MPSEPNGLADAMAAVLRPLSRLCVERGVPYADAAEQLKMAFVAAALGEEPQTARRVSRVSTATGINRREVTRLMAQPTPADEAAAVARERGRSVVTQVFAHWTTAAPYTRRGLPRVLPRQGTASSFESLARSITTDVHPRSILEQLVRLGLARVDDDKDTVTLVRDAFVPRGDALRMLGFLGANVGDHLAGAVDNVLGDGQRHFEQAIFADTLSDESMQQVRRLVTTQWKSMAQALVPELEGLIEADQASAHAATRRLRIGLYTYDAAMPPEAAAAVAKTPRKPRPRKEITP